MIDDNTILNTLDEIGNKTKYCPICDYIFQQRQGLILHLKSQRHHENREKMEEKMDLKILIKNDMETLIKMR